MKTLLVYDPAMCCSTGVCGPSVDPDLLQLAALIESLKANGVSVHRYGLSQQPFKFAEKPIHAMLKAEGPACLPAIFIDGALFLKGRYPNNAERESLRQLMLA